MAGQDTGYFELIYEPPWKGIDVSLPENKIDRKYTPFATNWMPRAGELRSRPKLGQFIPGLPDNSEVLGHSSFSDANNVVHTVAISQTGLWQLNSNWRKYPGSEWSKVENFATPNSFPGTPASIQVFLNQVYFVIGDTNLYSWDGLTLNSAGGYVIVGLVTSGNFVVGETVTQATTGATAPVKVAANLGANKLQVGTITGTPDNSHSWTGGTSGAIFKPTAAPTVNVAPLQSIALYDTTNILYAGGFFLGELNAQLIMLYTIEQQNLTGKPTTIFPQRIRWSASGLPNVWDPTVNTSAGFNDEIDVPDVITGFLTIGRNGFVFRTNGITEMTSISTGVLPFDFNHLWASDRGIGNVYPYSIAGYGPVGFFISSDDIYELSLGGFKKIGGPARNLIFTDLAASISIPIASAFPAFTIGFPYLTYKIAIPMAGGITKNWCYFVEDDSWFPWIVNSGLETSRCRIAPTL